MNIEELRWYCMAKKGMTKEFPFDASTLMFNVMGKMFALNALERIPIQVNLKCNLEKCIEMSEIYDGSIIEGYQMNEIHWISPFQNKLLSKLIAELTNHSYCFVVSKLTKKQQQELSAL
jgi:predicted DNA-binding protein (MmcQ/YjbR family)